jgi:hypothetical protein
MRISHLALFTVLLAHAAPADASDEWFCLVHGGIKSATLLHTNKARMFELVVTPSRAERSQLERGAFGPMDCNALTGKQLTIRLQIPQKFGPVREGGELAFNYSSIDTFHGLFSKVAFVSYAQPREAER